MPDNQTTALPHTDDVAVDRFARPMTEEDWAYWQKLVGDEHDQQEKRIADLTAAIMSVQRSAFDAGFDAGAGQDGGIRARAYEAWAGQQ